MSLMQRVLDQAFFKQNNDRLPTGLGNYFGGAAQSSQPSGQVAQMNAMNSVAWVFAVVNRIAQSVAAQEWKLYRVQDGERVELTEHPAKSLWESANPFITREDLLETTSQHMELVGESWIVVVRNGSGVPIELQAVRPDRMKPIAHPTEFIMGYEYRLGSNVVELDKDDVIFMRTPNPLDAYRGSGVVQSLMVDLGAERAAAEWSASFFRNSAEPGGVIEFPSNLSDQDFERLASRWKASHQGTANAHRVAILERGVWKDRKITQRDMEFSSLRKLSRDTILGAWGIPHAVLGITESVNRANAEAAELLYARWIIRPRLMRIRAALNNRLLKLFPDGDTLAFDFIDPVPENRTEMLQEAKEGFANGFLTLNETRRRLNEDAWEGPEGDELKPASPAPAQPMLQDLELSYKPRPRKVADIDAYPDEANDSADLLEKNWTRRLQAELRGIIAHLENQVKGITKLTPDAVDDYDWDWFTKYGDEVAQELSASYASSLSIELPNMPIDQVQERAGRYAYLRAGELLSITQEKGLPAVTRLQVRALVGKAIETGQTVRGLSRQLEKDKIFSADRAKVVARTEVSKALGEGQKSAAKVRGQSEKRWITQGDDLVADNCAFYESLGWIPIDEEFEGGIDTVPGHPNCRCVVQYRSTPLVREEWDGAYENEPIMQSSVQFVPEARCPKCKRLGGTNVAQGTSIRCRRCKHEWRT